MFRGMPLSNVLVHIQDEHFKRTSFGTAKTINTFYFSTVVKFEDGTMFSSKFQNMKSYL